MDLKTRLLAGFRCRALAALSASLLLQGCVTTPSTQPLPPVGDIETPPVSIDTPQLPSQPGSPASVGSELVIRAISLLGAPYKYGGNGPKVFDCSGLVRFVHHELGIDVPRTAAEQFRAATPVDLDDLEPGDLLFFRISGKRVSHVGIYAGSGRFVHAPQTGRPVELRTFDDEYYRRRFAGVGRFF